MFFSVSKQLDSRFPYAKNMGSWWICTDTGWQHWSNDQGHFWAKGYGDTATLDVISDQWDQKHSGNYTVIRCNGSVEIKTPTPRTYPLGDFDTCVSNLFDGPAQGLIHGNDELRISGDWQVSITDHSQDNTTVLEPAVDSMASYLVRVNSQFLKTYQPAVQLYVTGGLDTTLIRSMLDYLKYPYQLITDDHYDLDWFTRRNRDAIQDDQYSQSGWGYRQIHHYTDPTWIASGAWGDEYFLRGPETVAMLSSWHGIDLVSLLEPTDYHYSYYIKHREIFERYWTKQTDLRKKFSNAQALNDYITDVWLPNDFQHWHLGQTLTWTPLKHLAIARALLTLDIDALIPQFRDGVITRQLIAHFNPARLGDLDPQKNL